jgi:hydroxymethylpyrimidine pyrophosphatase-like HAD family hydrolase
MFTAGKRPSDKVQAIFLNDEDKLKAWKEIEETIPDIEITGALDNNIEVNAAGVSKGKTLVNLGKLLGIRREEIMACGDGANDTDMIREAGLGVAMANAVECVKEAADVMTDSNDEEGVAKAIEKYVLKDPV